MKETDGCLLVYPEEFRLTVEHVVERLGNQNNQFIRRGIT
jgi:hypothetical protein